MYSGNVTNNKNVARQPTFIAGLVRLMPLR